jgi:ubiquitin carboxyl-terminal hydrolase 36/42
MCCGLHAQTVNKSKTILMSAAQAVSAGNPVDLTLLSRELLPRRIKFERAKRPDFIERPKNVVNLNPQRPGGLGHQAGAGGAAASNDAPQAGTAAGDFGVRPAGHDEEDPLYAVPEAVLQHVARSASVRWPEVRGPGCGLVNLGNTCFMNSVLQAITYTPPLANYLTTVTANPREVTFDALFALGDVIRRLQSASPKGPGLVPKLLAANLTTLLSHRHFRRGQQADAHEFAIRLFDASQIVLMRRLLPGRKVTALAEYTSPLMRVLGGYLRSQVRWSREEELQQLRKLKSAHVEFVQAHTDPHKYASNTFEPSCVLHLPLAGASLDDCMKRFCAADRIEGYKTPRGAPVTVLRNTVLHRLPKALVVHLKRFNNALQKVNRHIDFPELWNLAPFCSAEALQVGQCTEYRLASVVVHHGGSLTSGHYTAFIRAPNQLWYHADDERMSQSNPAQVRGAQAYMLFYVQTRDNTSVDHRAAGSGVSPQPPQQSVRTAEDDENRYGMEVASPAAAFTAPKPQPSPRIIPAEGSVPVPRLKSASPLSRASAALKPVPPMSDDDESHTASASEDTVQDAVRQAPENGRGPSTPRRASTTAGQQGPDSDEESIADTPLPHRKSAKASKRLASGDEQLSFIAEDNTIAATPAPRQHHNPKRGLIRSRTVVTSTASSTATTEQRAEVRQHLEEEAKAMPASLRKKAYEGTFATLQRDADWEAEFDRGHVKRTRAEKMAEAIESGKRLPNALGDGRNRFQEVSNIRTVKKQRGEDWMDESRGDGNGDARSSGHRGGRDGKPRGGFGSRGRGGGRDDRPSFNSGGRGTGGDRGRGYGGSNGHDGNNTPRLKKHRTEQA